jgi:hypothetical protein
MSAGDYIAVLAILLSIAGPIAGYVGTNALVGYRVRALEEAKKASEEVTAQAQARKEAESTRLQLVEQRVQEHERRLEGHSDTLKTVARMETILQRVVEDVEEIRLLVREASPNRVKPTSEAETVLAGLRDLLTRHARAGAT